MASGIRKNKVSVVCVYDENHVTSIKVENDIRVSAEIVKHPVNCFDCGFCRFGLLGSDFVEGDFDAWVDFRIIGVSASD